MYARFTPKEEKLLKFIESFQLREGKSPTVREMREHLKLKSDGFVIYLMKALERKKAIDKDDTPRGIKLMPRVREKLDSETVQIPILGYIPAGGPVLTEEFVEDWMSLDSKMAPKPKDFFILKVKGESMINAGILDGDYVLVHTKPEVRKGDIVVGLVDNENTVKRFMIDKHGRPFLQPENEKFEPIYPEGELATQGKVVGLFRWY